jgi:hypothetical protein
MFESIDILAIIAAGTLSLGFTVAWNTSIF